MREHFNLWSWDGMTIDEIIIELSNIKKRIGVNGEVYLNVDLYGDYQNDSEFRGR